MRWYTVIATKSVYCERMSFCAEAKIEVLASSVNDAMRRVRPEFKGYHLRVIQ